MLKLGHGHAHHPLCANGLTENMANQQSDTVYHQSLQLGRKTLSCD